MYKLLSILFLSLLATFSARSTVDLPSFLIQNYTVDDYKASCQNWDLAVSYDGLLYVANNSGLLTYDGNTWRSYSLPDKSPLTHITFFYGTVYTQGPTSKGYWLPDAYGRMTYQPLDSFPPGVGFEKTAPTYTIPSAIAALHPTASATVGPLHFTGTARDGLYVTGAEGEILTHLSTQNQLPDNIVRALCVQDVNLVWAAFDNGLSQIETDPSVTLLARRSVIGKLQAATLHGDTLYIRTNTGYFQRPLAAGHLFRPLSEEEGRRYLPEGSGEMPSSFSPAGSFPGSKTFSSSTSTRQTPGNQTSSSSLSAGQALGSEASSCPPSARQTPDARLNRNEPGQAAIPSAPPSNQYPAPTYDLQEAENTYFSEEKAVFLPVTSLFSNAASLETFAAADGIYPARDSLYWLTAGNEAGLFHCVQGEATLKCRILFDNYNMNLVTSGKRIFPLNDSLDLVSTMQGALLVNTRRLIAGGLGGLTMPRFRQISYTDTEGPHPLRPDTSRIILPHSFQELTVYIGTTVFTPHHQISYKLEGVSTEWSPWQKSGKISFLQLPEGKYELRVRKYVAKGPYPEISLLIEVRPPWYNTVWAYLGYLLLIWCIGRALLKQHLRNLRREEQRRQEAERQAEQQKLQQMKSEMLEAELQNKSNELLLQTSALVKRNQAIQSFLDELERQKETLGDRYPNKLYNKMRSLMEETLNDQAGWLQFETYFNGAHRHFMDRLQHQYDDLTTGDLRICCLLRMNLSTKEIASLLNISVRAVELRRYRLRKRLGLEGETNLVEFLMKF